jgi:DNA primase
VSVFEEIKRQLDIVEVISEYVPLKKVGNSYSALCPFHAEKTPSFYVSPARQIWKCFGCGKGGDVIKFVAEYENISYREAAKLLVQKYNLDIQFDDEKREEPYKYALKRIAQFYKEQLAFSPEAKEYLFKVRKIPPSAVEKFDIGFSPNGFGAVSFARKEGIFEQLVELKHFYKTSTGHYRDFFGGRVVIPIRNIIGSVIAFGGRNLDGSHPKYKNSPNSVIFQKERTLFGIDKARLYAKEREKLIVVEGYFDVIRLHSVGFGETVAPLGTSLTEHHARSISKYSKRVLLLFDGDEAGRRAAFEAAKRLLKFPVEVEVCFLPSGEDPDSFVLKYGSRELRKILESSKPLREFLIERIVKTSGDKRRGFIQLFKELVDSITDGVTKEFWLKELRDKAGLNLKGRKVFLSSIRTVLPPLDPREVDFLLGLLHLEDRPSLKDFNLSEEALRIATDIVEGKFEKLPKWLLEADKTDLERRYKSAKEYLSVDRALELETFKELFRLEKKIEEGKAAPDDILRFHRLLGIVNRKLYEIFKSKLQTQKVDEKKG